MTTEAVVQEEISDAPLPLPVEADTNGKSKLKGKGKGKEDGEERTDERPAPPQSPQLREVIRSSDATLRDIIMQLGAPGGYRIGLVRIEPKMFQDSKGMQVKVAGHLRTYDEPIDEARIQQEWGGGTFDVKFQRQDNRGSFVHFAARRVEIAGDPRTDTIPRNVTPEQPREQPRQPAESATLVTKAFDVLTDRLERAESQPRVADNAANNETTKLMVATLEKQLDASHAMIAKLQSDIHEIRTQKPAEDPIKERIFTSLIENESARISHLRATHESEIRQLKESHAAEVKRIEDRADRDRSELRQSFERERQTLTHSHEVAMSAFNSSKATEVKILEQQNRTLERDIDVLRKEIIELRSKREKTVPEMAKELQAVKDVLDLGGDDEKQSWSDKIGDFVTNPEAIAAIGSIIRPGSKAPAAPVPQAAAVRPQFAKQTVKAPDGKTYQVQPNGQMLPMRPKTKEEKGLPQLPPDTIRTAITYLERAFEGGQDPAVVAQSARTLVPNDIIVAIRDHGIDVFMTKIAKIPVNSSLSSQEARNWVRKFGTALVG